MVDPPAPPDLPPGMRARSQRRPRRAARYAGRRWPSWSRWSRRSPPRCWRRKSAHCPRSRSSWRAKSTRSLCLANQIPHLLREIGRLREYTFRGAGEGTARRWISTPLTSIYLHLLSGTAKSRRSRAPTVWGKLMRSSRAMVLGAYTQTLSATIGSRSNLDEPALRWATLSGRSIEPFYAGRSSPLERHRRDTSAGNPTVRRSSPVSTPENGYQVIPRQLIVAHPQAGADTCGHASRLRAPFFQRAPSLACGARAHLFCPRRRRGYSPALGGDLAHRGRPEGRADPGEEYRSSASAGLQRRPPTSATSSMCCPDRSFRRPTPSSSSLHGQGWRCGLPGIPRPVRRGGIAQYAVNTQEKSLPSGDTPLSLQAPGSRVFSETVPTNPRHAW